jgi:hypothetical protein
VLEFPSKQDAVENARRMADLHAEHWPKVDVTVTLRQISEAPPTTEG